MEISDIWTKTTPFLPLPNSASQGLCSRLLQPRLQGSISAHNPPVPHQGTFFPGRIGLQHCSSCIQLPCVEAKSQVSEDSLPPSPFPTCVVEVLSWVQWCAENTSISITLTSMCEAMVPHDDRKTKRTIGYWPHPPNTKCWAPRTGWSFKEKLAIVPTYRCRDLAQRF